jgi:hypothetical protein
VKPQPSANDPRVVGGAGIQMRKDAAEQYLAYKLIDSNQDWKSKWFYITNHHSELPKPSGKQPKHRPWWNTEPTMQEGIQLPELLAKIKALREGGVRAEHVAFSFMKRRVQPLMACDTLGYQYTSDGDSSWMPGADIDDDDIVDRLGRIFKDMPAYTPCPVPEYSFIYLIISHKTRLLFNSHMGVHFSSFHFKNSTESFISLLLKNSSNSTL